jgi:hypothetical protein
MPDSLNHFGRLYNLVEMVGARNSSKPAQGIPKEQPYPGRAEFFAPPGQGVC